MQPCTAELWIYFDNWLKEVSVSPHNFSNVSVCISVLWSWEYQQIFCPLSEKFIPSLSHPGCWETLTKCVHDDHQHQAITSPSASPVIFSASLFCFILKSTFHWIIVIMQSSKLCPASRSSLAAVFSHHLLILLKSTQCGPATLEMASSSHLKPSVFPLPACLRWITTKSSGDRSSVRFTSAVLLSVLHSCVKTKTPISYTTVDIHIIKCPFSLISDEWEIKYLCKLNEMKGKTIKQTNCTPACTMWIHIQVNDAQSSNQIFVSSEGENHEHDHVSSSEPQLPELQCSHVIKTSYVQWHYIYIITCPFLWIGCWWVSPLRLTRQKGKSPEVWPTHPVSGDHSWSPDREQSWQLRSSCCAQVFTCTDVTAGCSGRFNV